MKCEKEFIYFFDEALFSNEEIKVKGFEMRYVKINKFIWKHTHIKCRHVKI